MLVCVGMCDPVVCVAVCVCMQVIPVHEHLQPKLCVAVCVCMQVIPVHEHLQPKLAELYELDLIFDKFEAAVIKSSFSAASPMTKMQGSPRPPPSAWQAVVHGLPCILVIGEAAPAADLITGSIFKHLEHNLRATTARQARFS